MNQPSGSSLSRTLINAADRAAARRNLIERRQTFNAASREPADAGIMAAADRWLAGRRVAGRDRVLGVYWPMRGEPSLVAAYAGWLAAGFSIALPRVQARVAPLQFGRWTPGCRLIDAGFQVMVPEPFESIEPDLLILPCVGFDPRGYRLGYGGGYYDRTLAHRPVPALGVSYDDAEVTGYQPQAHDWPLDAIVTERRVLTFRR